MISVQKKLSFSHLIRERMLDRVAHDPAIHVTRSSFMTKPWETGSTEFVMSAPSSLRRVISSTEEASIAKYSAQRDYVNTVATSDLPDHLKDACYLLSVVWYTQEFDKCLPKDKK